MKLSAPLSPSEVRAQVAQALPEAVRSHVIIIGSLARDRKDGTDELAEWPQRMWQALQAKFGDQARPLSQRAGTGISALLSSSAELQQALRIANLGLLTSMDVGVSAIQATGRRFQAEVLEPLAAF
ncbi:MAG: hypothetical protein A3F78_06730 [Burkholderiales bacterium RIFCSPLOWO2_12_FULL_61_40]|nr:MAG: hypothetical protein A3F78_06730 [Burkholderiales bacterium RIFCSPLOWO2_12_FULL_61_40]